MVVLQIMGFLDFAVKLIVRAITQPRNIIVLFTIHQPVFTLQIYSSYTRSTTSRESSWATDGRYSRFTSRRERSNCDYFVGICWTFNSRSVDVALQRDLSDGIFCTLCYFEAISVGDNAPLIPSLSTPTIDCDNCLYKWVARRVRVWQEEFHAGIILTNFTFIYWGFSGRKCWKRCRKRRWGFSGLRCWIRGRQRRWGCGWSRGRQRRWGYGWWRCWGYGRSRCWGFGWSRCWLRCWIRGWVWSWQGSRQRSWTFSWLGSVDKSSWWFGHAHCCRSRCWLRGWVRSWQRSRQRSRTLSWLGSVNKSTRWFCHSLVYR